MGPKGRTCIFIRYGEHSKGYVFIGELEDRTIIELESWDVTFLEDDFPSAGAIARDLHLYDGVIDRELHLYEMIDHDIWSTLKQKLMLEPSRSELKHIASTVTQYSLMMIWD